MQESFCIVPRGFAARQLKCLHEAFVAGTIQVTNGCGGLILDERRIIKTSTGVVRDNVKVAVAALSALVSLDLSLEAVLPPPVGGSESRRGHGGQGKEDHEVIHVDRLFLERKLGL